MKVFSKRGRFPGVFVMFYGTSLLLTLPPLNAQVQGQRTTVQVPGSVPTVHFSTNQAENFSEAITFLSETFHVTVVAEGVPQHPHLSVQDVARLTTSSLTLSDAIDQVATAYGYTVQQQEGVFILKKSYNTPDDLPELTDEECRQALKQLEYISAPFVPHLELYRPWPIGESHLNPDQFRLSSPLIDPISASLTDTQLNIMHDKGLPVSSLSEKQQKAVRQVLLYFYVQAPMSSVNKALLRLEKANETAVFHWGDLGSIHHLFGYDLPRNDQGGMLFHPLSGEYSTQSDLAGLLIFSGPVHESAVSDLTNPIHEPANEDVLHVTTLAAAVVALSKSENPTLDVNIDPAVRTKAITFVGADNASPLKVLRALATVYGLHLVPVAGSPVKMELTLPQVTSPLNITSLPEALRQALPDPYVQALHINHLMVLQSNYHSILIASTGRSHLPEGHSPDVEETQSHLEDAIQERKAAINGPDQFRKLQDEIRQAKVTPTAIRITAIRRLRTLIEPKLSASANGIAFSGLGISEQDAFATTLLVDATSEMIDLLSQPVPDYIINSNHLVLTGGISGDKYHLKFNLSFAMPASDGQLIAVGPVISNIDYTKGR